MRYKILALSALLLLFGCLCGCEKGNGAYIFKAAIVGNPKTLDPQTALADSSADIIHNTFRGLFRYDSAGNIVPDMAESYSVSSDGLEWTFTLRGDVYWYAGDFSAKCTADDFVFAFRRLVNPAVKSSNASDFFVLKNAEKINSGKITDLSMLGVEAEDEATLRITLEYPDSDLPVLLASSAAMPCNEDFFETTEGRYGLSADCVASNGAYYVHTWSYDAWSEDSNYFILRRNTFNASSDDESIPAGMNFFIDAKDEYDSFCNGSLGAYISESEGEIRKLRGKYSYSTYETDVWGLVFNPESFGDVQLRLKFAEKCEFSDSDCYRSAWRITPPFDYGEKGDFAISGKNFDFPAYVSVIMPQNKELREQMNAVAQKWRTAFGVSCNVFEPETQIYEQRLKSGDYDIALVRISGGNSSKYAYLSAFLSDSPINFTGMSSKKYDHILDCAKKEQDEDIRESYYSEAESFLLESGLFVPVCSQTYYVFFNERSSGMCYNPYLDAYIAVK